MTCFASIHSPARSARWQSEQATGRCLLPLAGVRPGAYLLYEISIHAAYLLVGRRVLDA